MINDDDVAATSPPLRAEALARVESTLYTANASQLSASIPPTLAHSIRTLIRRDVDAHTTRGDAVRHIARVVNALHTRERNFPSADVSICRAVPDDALVATVHVLATRALSDADESIALDAVRILLSLLHAQTARPAAGAYWSRAFFFECDFAECLIALLIRAAAAAPPALPLASSPLADAAPLALHALAALCNVRPVENADENAVEKLSRTALHLRSLSDAPLLDALTAAIDEGLKRCLRFYTTHTRPITNEADENVFDRIASWLAAPFAYLTGVPIDGFVPDEPTSHHEVRDTAAALAILFELLKHNDAWCKRLLAAHDEANVAAIGTTTTSASTLLPTLTVPRILRRLLLLSSFVFGDAQDARSLVYASVCAALLERMVLRPALFLRLAGDTEPLLLFTLTSNTSGAATTPLVGLAPVLATLAQVLYRARSGPLALDALTRSVRALLAVLRMAREQRCTVQWARFASLWRAALTLLQRLAPLRVSAEARGLCILTLQLLNDAITFGNTFLPTSGDYDALFYELLLQRGALEDVFHAVDLSDNAPEREALRAQLVNLRIIVTHFSTLLMSISESDDANAVLRVIQRGMQSLKLRLLLAPRGDEEEQRRERQLMHRFVGLAVADVMAPLEEAEDAQLQLQQKQTAAETRIETPRQ